MNRLFVALPVLLCIAGVASSQSLADLAKKEKERRKENAKQGNKTAFEAVSVGSFGHVWWRDEDVTTGGAPAAKSDSEAAPAETTTKDGTRRPAPHFGAKSVGSSSAKSDSEAAPTKTTTKGGTRSNRGELPLRKSSRRRP